MIWRVELRDGDADADIADADGGPHLVVGTANGELTTPAGGEGAVIGAHFGTSE